MKIHWEDEQRPGPWMSCGLRVSEDNQTEDPGKVTCASCLTHIERAFEPVAVTLDREATKAAKTLATSRARSDLIENHREEFEVMVTEYAEALYDEALKVATDARARFVAWNKKRDDARRAKLEAELETLG